MKPAATVPAPFTAAERTDRLVRSAHLAASSGKRLALMHLGLRRWQALVDHAARCAAPGAASDDGACVTPLQLCGCLHDRGETWQ